MKDVWVLYERSDLSRGGEWDYQNYATKCRVFENFETARKAMQNLVTSYATEENSMFDGKGNIKEFADEEYFSSDEQAMFGEVETLLKKLCLGELSKEDINNIEDFFVTNYMFAAEITVDDSITLLIRGDDDGPINDVNPYVHTNMFVMDDETKDYFFYVEDMFNMYRNFNSHLFIDLKKVSVE